MAVKQVSGLGGVWWVSPAGAVAIVVVPSLLASVALGDQVFRTAWDTPRWLTGGYATLLLVGALVFAVASTIPLLFPKAPAAKWPGLSATARRRLETASSVIFWMTIAGYAAYLLVGVARGARPADFIAVFSDESAAADNLKELFAPIAGVTTLTQFGIAYVVIAALLLVDGWDGRIVRRMTIIFAAGLLRAFFLSERLAILELILPVVAIAAMVAARSAKPRVRSATGWMPVMLVPLVVVVFSIFEYSRSWAFYRSRSNGGFVQFAVERFAGYYATAYNNGEVFHLFEATGGRLPLRTLDAFWTAPVVEQLGLYGHLSSTGFATYAQLLTQKANPEFNNTCGLCDPFLDWGTAGGLLWWALAGLLLGLAYRSYCAADLRLLLLYPPLVTGLFEIPRYVYWTEGRLAPALLALFAVGWWARRPVREKHVGLKELLRA